MRSLPHKSRPPEPMVPAAAMRLLWLAFFTIAGCSEPRTAPSPAVPAQPAPAAAQAVAPAQQAPAAPSPAAAPAPTTAEQSPPGYSYIPGRRPDPFMPLIIKEEKKAPKAGLPPLERHAITEFKFTGVVWGGFGYNAMLEGPDGKGYFIRVGTRVGQNGGVVKKIGPSSLVIEETYKTFAGETRRREIVVELHRTQEGTP